MEIDHAYALEAFRRYIEPYDTHNPRIALKVAHTYRVADLCTRIAAGETFPTRDIDLAWLCGLLHDLGRFEQLRRWDTFSDAKSTSHAQLGVSELFETPEDAPGNIRRFVEDAAEDELIRQAVGLHSDLRLPDGLDARTRSICTVVRDADKIDILHVMSESSVETVLGVSEQAFLASGFSSQALQAFGEHRCLARSERHEPADYLVGLICFAFELEYETSRREFVERGDIFRVLDDPFGLGRPFARSDAQDTWRRLGRELRAYLAA